MNRYRENLIISLISQNAVNSRNSNRYIKGNKIITSDNFRFVANKKNPKLYMR